MITSKPEELGWRKIRALSVLLRKPPNWAKRKMFGMGNKGILKAWKSKCVCGGVSLEAVTIVGLSNYFLFHLRRHLSQWESLSLVQPGFVEQENKGRYRTDAQLGNQG